MCLLINVGNFFCCCFSPGPAIYDIVCVCSLFDINVYCNLQAVHFLSLFRSNQQLVLGFRCIFGATGNKINCLHNIPPLRYTHTVIAELIHTDAVYREGLFACVLLQ